jgi:large subunit ribosomal protein L21
MYAVIRTGGKQYTVREGDTLDVEILPGEAGEQVELAEVLMLGEVGDGTDITVGRPLIDGAKVVAEVVEHGKGKKIIVFKYKSKTRYRRKTGHRQRFTRLAIREIVAP